MKRSRGHTRCPSMQRSTTSSSLLRDGRTESRAFLLSHSDWPQTTVYAVMTAKKRPPMVRFQTDKYRVGLLVPSESVPKQQPFSVSNPSKVLLQQAGAQHVARRQAWGDHVKAEHTKQMVASFRLQRRAPALTSSESSACSAILRSHAHQAGIQHRSAPVLRNGGATGMGSRTSPGALPHGAPPQMHHRVAPKSPLWPLRSDWRHMIQSDWQ